MKLNEKQMEAVHHKEGPLLIIAGAGSGKTTVLSHRAKALTDNGVEPKEILCVTFTNKAVEELKSRIVKQIGEDGEQIWVSTFHELSRSILEMFREEPFSVTHTAESRQIVKKIIDEMPKTETTSPFLIPSTVMKIISLLKSELITTEFLEKKIVLKDYIDIQRLKEILTEEIKTKENLAALMVVYKKYEEHLRMIGKIDVDDMLLLATKMLVENPLALRYYHEHYHYIMIDEYQDTNRAQYILSKLLAKKYQNITAVGDDFQSIYKFRGSDIRNILSFDKDYPQAKIIKLEENYRSTKTILQAANEIIARNPDQKQKELYTAHEEGEKIKLHVADTSLDEARYVADQIKYLIDKGYEYRDIAIFYRNNAESSHFETVFPAENIPYAITKESSFFERKEIKDTLAYLQFAIEPTNSFAFQTCINTPKRGIGKTSIDRFIEQANGGDLLSSVKNPGNIKLNKNAQEGSLEFVRIMGSIQSKLNEMSISELIAHVLTLTDYRSTFSDLETHLKREKEDYLNLLISIAREMETEKENVTLTEFLSELSKRDMDQELSEGKDFNRVNLLTVHSSKGLEFPVVFLVGMKEKGFPSKYAISDKAIEEERRLCYVAFTRAKKELFVSYPKVSQETNQENPKEKIEVTNEPSRFLGEFDHSLVAHI